MRPRIPVHPGGGELVELVEQADVLGLPQAPEEPDLLLDAFGAQAVHEEQERPDPHARRHEHELVVLLLRHHRPARGAAEGDGVTGVQRGEVDGQGPIGNETDEELEGLLLVRR
jgi:hypothetical protein